MVNTSKETKDYGTLEEKNNANEIIKYSSSKSAAPFHSRTAVF